MQEKDVLKKEVALLLRRHNKLSNVKLKSADVDIPASILNILCQKKARTREQIEKLELYRHKTIEQLLAYSNQILKQRQEKAKRTREVNLEKDPSFVKHFGVWIDSTRENSKINREYYAKIDSRSSILSDAQTKQLAKNGCEPYVFDKSGEYGVYSKEWCLSHRERCLKNFDINMERFASLDAESFNEILLQFTKGRKFHEVYDLNALEYKEPYSIGLHGYVYIMVFDEYKQAYIGITTTSLKQRIVHHWRKQRAFDRLIFGSVETSVISIDSFGPLDTTRIFVLPYSKERKTSLENYEQICIRKFNNDYLLNRLR